MHNVLALRVQLSVFTRREQSHVLTFVELWNFTSFFSCFSILRFYFSTFYICHKVKSSIKREKKAGTIILHRCVWRSMSIDPSYGRAAWAAVPRFPHTAAAVSLHGPIPLRDFSWASSVLPLAGRSRPGGFQGIPPQEGLLLPLSTHSTTGHTPTCGVPARPFKLGSAWGELR